MFHGLTQRTHVHEHYLMLLLLLLCGLSVITGRSWRSADKSASLHADTDTDTGVWHERFYRRSVNVKSDGPVCYPSSGRCSPNADCLTVSGKTYCVCKDGYQGDGSTCTQVDYCKMGAESCPGNSDCFNNVTVTYCQCKSGFSLGGLDNTQCQVDSCWTNPCGDPSISICYAYPNGYDCGCVSGYTWKDNKCVDVDECATSTHKCSEHATCTNTPGSYNCTCAEGYLNIDGKGRKCVYDVMLHIKTVSQCLVKEDDAITMVNLGGNSLQFGRTAHSEVYISTNGYVSFGSSYNAYYPKTDPSAPLVALYWADMDNSRSDSSICYTLHSDTSDDVFKQLGDKLAKYGVSLDAKFVVQVTYTNIHPYPAARHANEPVTAQLVLATDNVRTYALFNYAYNQMKWNPYATWRPLLVGSTEVLSESNWIHQVPPSTESALDQLVGNTAEYGSWYRQVGALGSKGSDQSVAASQSEGSQHIGAPAHATSGTEGERISSRDACSSDPPPCYPGTECNVLDGVVQCGSCPSGMENYEGDMHKCTFKTSCSPNPCKTFGCLDTSASNFTCQCLVGYEYSHGRNACVDINECRYEYDNPCAPLFCQNTPGSYNCLQCAGAGYTLHPNGTCVDVDECLQDSCFAAINNNICENTENGFSCSCKPGYARTHSECEDIDECESGVANCQYECVNLIGSYMCTCPFGSMSFNSTSCVPIDYCKQNVCPPGSSCQTLPDSSYECQLLPTTTKPTVTSTVITTTPDYCSTGLNNCSENANCLNVPGGWNCDCKEGFVGDGYVCVRITSTSTLLPTTQQQTTATTRTTVQSTKPAETTTTAQTTTAFNYCYFDQKFCHQHATCKLNETTNIWDCVCNPGFVGNGINCQQIDYCNSGLHNCSTNAICENLVNGWKCTCKPGFTGNGFACDEITTTTATTRSTLSAEPSQTTTPMAVTTTAQTTTAFNYCYFDQKFCHLNATCKLNEITNNWDCVCNSGYVGDGFYCEEINYCNTGLHNCSTNAICENLLNGWKCTCKPGYTGNGYNCDLITTTTRTTTTVTTRPTTTVTTRPTTTTAANKCVDNQYRCHPNATCKLLQSTNTWVCVCNEGFMGDGFTCEEPNYCGNGWHNCSIYADCTNVPGGWTCKCKPGYTGDGYNCRWINPCEPNPCGSGNCYPYQDGTYTCYCYPGFAYNSTTKKCEDVNECNSPTPPCPAGTICKNTIGSYICEPAGWIESITICTSKPDSLKPISLGCSALPYGDKLRSTLYLTKYGYATFDKSYSHSKPTNKPPSDVPLFAIWWSDIHWHEGKLCYSIHFGNVSSDLSVMKEVSNRISSYHNTNFTATIVIIINYDKVNSHCGKGHEKETVRAQGVVTSDGFRTYLMYNYPAGYMNWNGHSPIIVGSSMTITAGSPLNNMNWISQVPRKHPNDALLETYDLDKVVGNTGVVGSWWQYVGYVASNPNNVCCRWLQVAVKVPATNSCPSNHEQILRDTNFVEISRELISASFYSHNSKQKYRYCYADRFYALTYIYNRTLGINEAIYFKQQCCYDVEFKDGKIYKNGALHKKMPEAGTVFTSNTPEYEAYIRQQCILAKMEAQYIVYRPISTDKNYRPPNNGNGNGDPHFTTLDGAEYTFNGLGQYVLTRTSNLYTGPSPFSVHTETAVVTGNGGATIFKHFTVTASVNGSDSSSVFFYYNDKDDTVQVRVNGVDESIAADESKVFSDNLAISRSAESSNLTATYRHGLQVTVQAGFGGSLQIQLGLPQEYSKTLEGLLGSLDGDMTNDFKCKNGTILSANSSQRSLYDFGESWRVVGSLSSTSRADYTPLFLDEIVDDETKLLEDVFNNNNKLFDESKSTCSLYTISDKSRYTACMLDCAGLESSEAGNLTVQTMLKFDEDVKTLRNQAPVFNMQPELHLQKGKTLKLTVDVFDPDNTTVEIVIEWVDDTVTKPLPQLNSATGELEWTPEEEPENLNAWRIVASDPDGASTIWLPDLLYCACQNGNCSFDNYFNQSSELMSTSSNVYVGVCTCWGAYGGTYCERSPCGSDEESNPCYTNVACTVEDYNFVCAPCPDGLEGDGVACYNRFTPCYKNVSGEAVSRCGEFICREFNDTYACECPTDYVEHPDLFCVSIENCSVFDCKNNMTCINDKCGCPDGYIEDAINKMCFKLPEFGACKTGEDICKSNETNTECVELDSTGTSYKCTCKFGFEVEKTYNATHQQCKKSSHCPPVGTEECETCMETGNSTFMCTCRESYFFNTQTKKCELINYCDTNRCPVGSKCVSIPGGYTCEVVADIDVGLIIGIVVAAVVLLIILIGGIFYFCKVYKAKTQETAKSGEMEVITYKQENNLNSPVYENRANTGGNVEEQSAYCTVHDNPDCNTLDENVAYQTVDESSASSGTSASLEKADEKSTTEF